MNKYIKRLLTIAHELETFNTAFEVYAHELREIATALGGEWFRLAISTDDAIYFKREDCERLYKDYQRHTGDHRTTFDEWFTTLERVELDQMLSVPDKDIYK